jgi:hypothetical protein
VKIHNVVNEAWTEDVVGMLRMFSCTWSRCSIDGMLRMSSGGDVGCHAWDVIRSSHDLGSGQGNSLLIFYLFAQSDLHARCIYKPLRNSSAIPKVS